MVETTCRSLEHGGWGPLGAHRQQPWKIYSVDFGTDNWVELLEIDGLELSWPSVFFHMAWYRVFAVFSISLSSVVSWPGFPSRWYI